VGATDLNAKSSRSHTIFRMTIESRAVAPTATGRMYVEVAAEDLLFARVSPPLYS